MIFRFVLVTTIAAMAYIGLVVILPMVLSTAQRLDAILP